MLSHFSRLPVDCPSQGADSDSDIGVTAGAYWNMNDSGLGAVERLCCNGTLNECQIDMIFKGSIPESPEYLIVGESH